VLADRNLRVAMDESGNALVVSGNEGRLDTVRQLVEQLDQPTSTEEAQSPGETYHVRVLWLLDGLKEGDGAAPADFFNAGVMQSLDKLGFQNPKVVSQQVSTFTLANRESSGGQFNFTLPVLINAVEWQLHGTGVVSPLKGERFALQFSLNVSPVHKSEAARNSQLSGSIYTPLEHYTVMGTSTFVAEKVVDGSMSLDQHLSAFVVFLQRAEEFPADKTNQ
jgi:hypothetical protein